MRKWAARECRDRRRSQLLRAFDVFRRGATREVERAVCKRTRQPALSRYGTWIKRQCALEELDRCRVAMRRWGLPPSCCTSPENTVQCVEVFGRSSRLRVNDFEVERDPDPARDFVLQCEEIFGVAVEPIGPEMRGGVGVDQLGVDAQVVVRPAD